MTNFRHYLITDPKYYTNNPIFFEKKLSNALKNNTVDITCFRDKTSSNKLELVKIFINVCKKYNVEKILINQDISLAEKFNIGIHLTSQQFNKINECKNKNLFTIISCHNSEELELAQSNYVDMVTYSPIYGSPNKGIPKGINNLKNMILKYNNLQIIALGGIINANQIEEVKNVNASGFASIRYFI